MVESSHEGTHQSHGKISRIDRSKEMGVWLPGSGGGGTENDCPREAESPSDFLGI